jgi:TRAP-type uncharacterized transport system fused permease subunit
MNLYPLETWVYRLIHVTGGLMLGFLLYSAVVYPDTEARPARGRSPLEWLLLAASALLMGTALVTVLTAVLTGERVRMGVAPEYLVTTFGWPVVGGTVLAVLASWFFPDRDRSRLAPADALLAIAALAVGIYIIAHAEFLRNRAGVFPHANDMWAAIAGIILILELTRRLAGMALVVIVALFVGLRLRRPLAAGVPAAFGLRARASSRASTPISASWVRPSPCRRPTSSSSSPSRPSCRPRGWASISSTSPSPRPAARAAGRPRSRSSARA